MHLHLFRVRTAVKNVVLFGLLICLFVVAFSLSVTFTQIILFLFYRIEHVSIAMLHLYFRMVFFSLISSKYCELITP